MERLQELKEKKWNIEARIRICANAKTREKWQRDVKAIDKLIRLNKKVNNAGATPGVKGELNAR